MKLEIEISGQQLQAVVIGSLKSYYRFLKSNPFVHEDDHEDLLKAFQIVLEEYLTLEEWEEYNQDLQ
jgi:hypothetical protein